METREISSLYSINNPTTIGVFDPLKFAKLIQGKQKRNWWHRFMEGVEWKKRQIRNELLAYSNRRK